MRLLNTRYPHVCYCMFVLLSFLLLPLIEIYVPDLCLFESVPIANRNRL